MKKYITDLDAKEFRNKLDQFTCAALTGLLTNNLAFGRLDERRKEIANQAHNMAMAMMTEMQYAEEQETEKKEGEIK